MLLVDTFIEGISGLGCYTLNKIVKDQKIHIEENIIDKEIDAIYVIKDSREHEFLVKYTSFNKQTNRFYLCGDNARFINDSSEPNLKREGIYLIATKDIDQYEELLLDYGLKNN